MMALPTPDLGNHSGFAIMLGVVLGILKLLEFALKWLKEKYSKDDSHLNGVNSYIPMVQLDPDTLRFIKEMKHDINRNQEALEDHMAEERIVLDSIRDIATCLKDVSHTQERLAKQFDTFTEKSNERFNKLRDDIHEVVRINANG